MPAPTRAAAPVESVPVSTPPQTSASDSQRLDVASPIDEDSNKRSSVLSSTPTIDSSKPEPVQTSKMESSMPAPNPRSPVDTSPEALDRAKEVMKRLSAASRSNSLQEQSIDLSKLVSAGYSHAQNPLDDAALFRGPVSQGSIQTPLAVELHALGLTVSNSVPCTVVLLLDPIPADAASRETVRPGDLVLSIDGISTEGGLQDLLNVLQQLEGSPTVTLELLGAAGSMPRRVELVSAGALSSFRWLSAAECDSIPLLAPSYAHHYSPPSQPSSAPYFPPTQPFSAPSAYSSRSGPSNLPTPDPPRPPLSGSLSSSPASSRSSAGPTRSSPPSPPTSNGCTRASPPNNMSYTPPTRASPPNSNGPTRTSPPNSNGYTRSSPPPPQRTASGRSSVRSTPPPVMPMGSPSMRPQLLHTASPSFRQSPGPLSPGAVTMGLPPMPMFVSVNGMAGKVQRRSPPPAPLAPYSPFVAPPAPVAWGI